MHPKVARAGRRAGDRRGGVAKKTGMPIADPASDATGSCANSMKSYTEYLALLASGDLQELSPRDARHLAGAMLDGGVPEVELGALAATMQRNSGSTLLGGFVDALAERAHRWPIADERYAPVAIGCYGGAWDAPNLAPLLGVVLARFGIPVVMHGPLHAHAGISSAILLRSLGIMPCAHVQDVAPALEARRIAFIPDALVAPGLASLIALRARLGATALFTLAARLINPFATEALIVAWTDDVCEFDTLRSFVALKGARALLLGCPQDGRGIGSARSGIEFWREGEREMLFEEQALHAQEAALGPDPASAEATALWMRQVCDGSRPLPLCVRRQFAACLHATGYCDDINQAKALAAIGASPRRVA